METGHSIFRTSIQWSRLIPKGIGEVNPQAVEFYRAVFAGIRAWDKAFGQSLSFRFTLCLTGKRGWENKEIVWYMRLMLASVSVSLEIWWIIGLPLMNPLFQ